MSGVVVDLALAQAKRERMMLAPPPAMSEEQARTLRALFGELQPRRRQRAA